MNTFSYVALNPFFGGPCSCTDCNPHLDWLDLPWGGPYQEQEEDGPIALCGSWDCSGDCDDCIRAELKLRGMVLLPIQGPVNRDGTTLGFLLVPE